MHNFLLFAGQKYYPEGGYDDFKGAWKNPDEALTYLNAYQVDRENWAHLVDANTNRIVHRWDCDEGEWTVKQLRHGDRYW